MKVNIRTTLIASAIAAMLAGPAWAASDTAKDGAYTPAPTKAELGQPTAREQSMGETPRVGDTAGSSDASRTSGATRSDDASRMSDTSRPGDASRMGDASRTGGAAYGGATARTQIGDNPLYTRSADELDGVEVIDRAGEKVGDIKQIVLAPDRKSAIAVISSGGFLGMGAREIMVSLDELTPVGGKLQMSATQAEIAVMKDAETDTDRYVEVKGDTPISGSIVEFSAFEQGKDANKPGAAPMTPGAAPMTPGASPMTPGASPMTPGATQRTPGADVANPATQRETPRVPQ